MWFAGLRVVLLHFDGRGQPWPALSGTRLSLQPPPHVLPAALAAQQTQPGPRAPRHGVLPSRPSQPRHDRQVQSWLVGSPLTSRRCNVLVISLFRLTVMNRSMTNMNYQPYLEEEQPYMNMNTADLERDTSQVGWTDQLTFKRTALDKR